MNAREEILERIASALAPRPAAQTVPRSYRHDGSLTAAERVELFCARLRDYGSEIHRVAEADAAALVAARCAARGARGLVVPGGLPAAWRSPQLELVDDADLSAAALDAVDGALTGCTVAVAETGTIVLAAGPAEGRRALTLVPDLHVCVVRASQIVELLPEALAEIAAGGLDRRPLTFVSGPSATSDIELSRVEGVHGPRQLVALVIEEEQ